MECIIHEKVRRHRCSSKNLHHYENMLPELKNPKLGHAIIVMEGLAENSNLARFLSPGRWKIAIFRYDSCSGFSAASHNAPKKLPYTNFPRPRFCNIHNSSSFPRAAIQSWCPCTDTMLPRPTSYEIDFCAGVLLIFIFTWKMKMSRLSSFSLGWFISTSLSWCFENWVEIPRKSDNEE